MCWIWNVNFLLFIFCAFYLYWICSLDTAEYPVQYPNDCAEVQLQVSNFTAVFLFCFVCLAKNRSKSSQLNLAGSVSAGEISGSCCFQLSDCSLQRVYPVLSCNCAACAQVGLKGWARLWTLIAENETFSSAAAVVVLAASTRRAGETWGRQPPTLADGRSPWVKACSLISSFVYSQLIQCTLQPLFPSCDLHCCLWVREVRVSTSAHQKREQPWSEQSFQVTTRALWRWGVEVSLARSWVCSMSSGTGEAWNLLLRPFSLLSVSTVYTAVIRTAVVPHFYSLW